jgi:hypothetical protein
MRRALVPLLLLLVACAGPVPSASPEPAVNGTIEPGPSATFPSAQPSAAEFAWQVLADAPFARLEMAVAAHDGRIWLAGGLSPLGEALTEVEIFDPASGEWSHGPSLPTGVHHASLVSDGERLLLIGGFLGAGPPTDLVLAMDNPDDGWTEGPRLPEPRSAGAAAFDGTRVVYAGGVAAGGEPMAEVFALAGGAWARLGEMARAREHLAATTDGRGTVWLLGGRVNGLATNLADVELVTVDGIEGIGALPTPRGGVAAFHAAELGACLTGGEAPDRAYTTVECIAGDGTIATLPQLNEPHHGHGAVVVDGVAYVLLGGPQPTLSADSTVESLRLP